MAEMRENPANWQNILENEIKLKGYSAKTMKSYVYYVGRFLKSGKSARKFLLDMINRGYKEETMRIACFAIRFYMRIVNKDNDDLDKLLKNIPVVKREKKLPVVLSRKDIERMIISLNNITHRAIIQTGYSAGMRVSEIINLKWEDIDFKRNTIHIKRAKGKKDRIVMLSPKVKKTLNKLTNEKIGLVFKTKRESGYSIRSIELIVKKAAGLAGINKNVTPHTLRHSFATHLLENGIDLRYIRNLLGHANIQTTLIYTKVSNKDISKIRSPLDL